MSGSVLVLSPALPVAQPDNAGARYVRDVLSALPSHLSPTLAVPSGPAARRAAEIGAVAPYLLLDEPPTGRSGLGTHWRQSLSSHPRRPGEFLWHLQHTEELRQAVTSASIIDLQWIEQAYLIRRLRSMNPHARIITTVHDVLSQRYGRQARSARDPLRVGRWRFAARLARNLEQLMMKHSDDVIVLSDKDRELLPSGRAMIHVVTPQRMGAATLSTRAPEEETILFVGLLARWEN